MAALYRPAQAAGLGHVTLVRPDDPAHDGRIVGSLQEDSMDHADGIARNWLAGRARGQASFGRSSALAHVLSAAVALLVLGAALALLLGAPPRPGGWSPGSMSGEAGVRVASAPLAAMPPANAVLGRGDTIDGRPVLDASFAERMKQVVARIPPSLLAGQVRDPRVRYLAHAFTPGDDPGLTEGWFQDPAAALAFGCAVDDVASLACDFDGGNAALAQVAPDPESTRALSPGAAQVNDVVPGWRCRPLGAAVGSPAFEPERCEWQG